jgi:hypothetical protein
MRVRLLPVVLLALAALGVAAPAGGQDPAAPPPRANPCKDIALHLRCPDLVMSAPSDLRVVRNRGGVRLEAANHIINVGQGPVEVRGVGGTGATLVSATQLIRRTGRRLPLRVPNAGWIYWKAIPGQGHYWKYWRAARFELWTRDADGRPGRLVRTGPKLSYCLRDLKHVRASHRSPRQVTYPACSEDFTQARLRLGLSPGWADIYPSSYHENWISIGGLHGCFMFLHRADPLGDLIEQREDNNVGSRVIELPPRRGSVAPRSCPPAR